MKLVVLYSDLWTMPYYVGLRTREMMKEIITRTVALRGTGKQSGREI